MPFPGHSQVAQDTADAPLILWGPFVHLRILQNLLEHVLRLNGAQQSPVVLNNGVQPLGDVARPMVQVEFEPKNLLVLQRHRGMINK